MQLKRKMHRLEKIIRANLENDPNQKIEKIVSRMSRMMQDNNEKKGIRRLIFYASKPTTFKKSKKKSTEKKCIINS